jgi:hypothetical protein
MAFERLEPFGSLHDEQMAGTISATVANVHRRKDRDPYSARHFHPALDDALKAAEGPPKALTPDEQSDLIVKMLQGVNRTGANGHG